MYKTKRELTTNGFMGLIATNQAPPRFLADFQEMIIEKKFMSVHYKNTISDFMLTLRDFLGDGWGQRFNQGRELEGDK